MHSFGMSETASHIDMDSTCDDLCVLHKAWYPICMHIYLSIYLLSMCLKSGCVYIYITIVIYVLIVCDYKKISIQKNDGKH